ncbi:hypothetical protein H257_11375 [Aphanomyces astaci]|uniref:HAT C-terminal dimerisation domain-containing protein n=1 Tax=Aphanomyces astaci TaxID=112090 RepID=W4G4X6_APHAT|nr:hypothetical protein H257_11375 [Aphanomyces astaci]ETV74064.1 hypothetical protein H257_11375 [Aphanomyces astaci]|eukprot:XP_009836577.1 hypothetical protein H257_11375 [Aphanomyces astaci]
MNKPNPNILRGRQLAELFFTRNAPGSTDWTCRCGVRRAQNGSGYSNLVSHITSEHPEYNTFDAMNPPAPTALFDIMVPRLVSTVYGWLHWITMSMLPFSFVSNTLARRYTKLDPISRTSFMKYMHALCAHVERTIASQLPDQFAIVHDGWSHGSTHYLAIFATFPSSDPIGYTRTLLAFAPINDEESLSADAHYEFTVFVLELYGKTWDNVIALIGDNCSTNGAFARRAGVPLIGYASHRFNLFMSDVLADHADVIDNVNHLMTNLRFTLPAARLHCLTPLVAKTNNTTRLEFDVTALLTKLEDLNAITLALQSEDCSFLDARQIFDTVIEDYPDAAARLGRSAAIVKNPAFEDGVVKVLLESEALKLKPSRRYGILKQAKAAKKKKKVMRALSVYKDCRFMHPTSNMSERFFSATKLAVEDRRCSITPKNFEEQMFLRANIHFWTTEDVQAMMRTLE